MNTMNTRVIIGAGLILLGAVLFLNIGSSWDPGTIISYFWPSIFIIPFGILFHWMYFSVTSGRATGLLIPGGLLLTVGTVCQVSMLFDAWSYMWPGFILAPAVGLFEFYLFGNRNKWLLIPINILTGLSLLFFAIFSLGTLFSKVSGQPLIAIVIIVIGLFMLIGKRKTS